MNFPIIEKIQTLQNLPSLPTVAMEILQLVQAEDVAVADIAAVVQQDPALTAKILRTANSPLFGMPRTISSLSQAVMVLGLRAVKMMVLSFSLVEALGDDKHSNFNYTKYWRRSLITATSARMISMATGSRQAEEVFVAGLLSEVGMVAASRCAPELYQPVLEYAAVRQQPLREIEAERLGITHAVIGREVMAKWNLPEILCESVKAHHGEDLETLSGDTLHCAKLVHCGVLVADLFCQDTLTPDVAQTKKRCCELSGIDAQALEGILEQLKERVEQTASLLAIDVGQVMNYATLQEGAATQLVQLSMQAEIERAAASDHARQAREQADRLRVENQTIRKAAATDALTRIANRAAFDQRLAETLEQARAERQPLGLILLDVDHFKSFNDTHGHQAGDEVLQHIGACLERVASQAGFVARYGGEEFAVILANQTTLAVRQIAEEICRAIRNRPIEYAGKRLRVTASLGAACAKPGEQPVTAKQLIEQADRHLYRAKRGGRNRVEMPK